MKRILSFCVAVVLVLTLSPIALAKTIGEGTYTLTILNQDHSTLAPGVTQDIVYSKMGRTGNQMVYYLATADLSDPTVHVYANYKDNQWESFGFQKVTDQMAAAQRIHSDPESGERYIPNYNVVAGINADFYDMSSGKPNGAFAMEGHIVSYNGGSFFAIRKNGEAVVGFNTTDWNLYNTEDNPIVEAVGGGDTLIKNNQIVNTNWGNTNARTAIGVTADNKVVMLVVDGKQLPFSEGGDMMDLATILKNANCVNAINLDGGGSTTYAAKPEGKDDIELISRPCDTMERLVSSSLMIVSTAPDSDAFDHAKLNEDMSDITPNGTVKITADGATYGGKAADIPEDVSWTLSDPDFGTIKGDNSGAVFTSTGKQGAVDIQLNYNGEIVGSTSVNVVIPDHFAFAQVSYAVPFGKYTDILLKATYEERTVGLHQGDIKLEMSDPSLGELVLKEGTFDTFTFTACAEAEDAPTSGSFSATLTCKNEQITVPITLGKGSELIFDFEGNDDRNKIENFTTRAGSNYDYKLEIDIVDKEHGKVHDGEKSLRVLFDYSNIKASTYGAGGVFQPFVQYLCDRIDVSGAVSVGMWVWVPDEDMHTSLMTRVVIDGKNDYKYTHDREGKNYDEGHWIYISYDLTAYAGKKVEINPDFFSVPLWDQNGEIPMKSLNNKMVFYIDSYYVDYSSVAPDRAMPTLQNVRAPATGDEFVALNRGEIHDFGTTGTVYFMADAADPVNSNTTGIDEESAEAYIDGVKIGARYQNGKIITDEVSLPAGVHTLKLYISDLAGNTTNATRQFKISANSDTATVSLVRSESNKNTDKIPITSLYYVDVKASDVSKIQSVTMDLDLNNISRWELDHADVNGKFSMSWEFADYFAEDENVATLTFTRTEDWEEGDDDVIASLPIRTWGTEYDGDVTDAWKNQNFFPVDVTVDVDRGQITYTDGYDPGVEAVFGGERIQVDTELYTYSKDVVAAAGDTKTHWHVHDEQLIPQSKDATCTEAGYTGRTYCQTCSSVVEWGTEIDAKGHHYEVIDGVLQCKDCHITFSGVYEPDGKTYVDGKVMADGWTEENGYYKDGKLVTNVQKIEELYFDFGEDGICEEKEPLTGFFKESGDDLIFVGMTPEKDDFLAATHYYAIEGVLQKGWVPFGTADDQVHIGDDGKVHGIADMIDTTTCNQNGHKEFTCPDPDCKAWMRGEALWYKGHTWDDDHVCTVCGWHGIDIANATIKTDGTYFTYTGSGIRAAHTVTYNGRELSVRSDHNGMDGYSEYSDNVEIGIATITIRGERDFYGTLVGHFTIVPESVNRIEAVEGKDHSITLSWAPALGAGYYGVYTYNFETNLWEQLGTTDGTTYTVSGLEIGDNYALRVGSRTDVDGTTYYCTKWSNIIEGTVKHDWGDPSEDSHDATCTEDGVLTHTCEVCGETETLTTKALGHQVEEWVTTREPTMYEEGERSGECTVCGETVTEPLEKLPYVNPGSKTETVTNPDGSTTTTTTNPDGSATQTTTTPEGVTGQVTTDARGEVTAAEVVIPEAKDGEVVTAPVELQAAKDAEKAPEINVRVGKNSARVEIPVTDMTPGTVAVVVHEDGTEEIVRDCAVTEDGIVLGVEGEVTVKLVDATEKFADDSDIDSWADGAVDFVAARDLFGGNERHEFEPDRNMTRGMLVTVLHRLAYEPDSVKTSFGDVPEGKYYAEAVAWAVGLGVVDGKGDNSFAPEEDITRQDLAVILYRYAGKMDYRVTRDGTYAGFVDAADVSSYAREAMDWAVSMGLINGKGDRLAPKDHATRAEVAAIFMRFCGNVIK